MKSCDNWQEKKVKIGFVLFFLKLCFKTSPIRKIMQDLYYYFRDCNIWRLKNINIQYVSVCACVCACVKSSLKIQKHTSAIKFGHIWSIFLDIAVTYLRPQWMYNSSMWVFPIITMLLETDFITLSPVLQLLFNLLNDFHFSLLRTILLQKTLHIYLGGYLTKYFIRLIP